MERSIFENKLRKHQKEALKIIDDYLEVDETNYHALVKIPTGGGKSGVIASFVNTTLKYNKYLIIVPNKHLTYQLKEEIEQGFWNSIGVDTKKLDLLPVYLFDEVNSESKISTESGIVIITVQYLHSLYDSRSSLYSTLKDNIDVVVFDEGHREPASEWSRASREIGEKTILFTATPIRNDDKSFRLTYDKYIYNYSHFDAVKDENICDVTFKNFDRGIQNDVEALANEIIMISKKNPAQKIIVRCEGDNKIRNLVKVINKKYANNIALGCHSTFEKKDEKDNLFTSVEKVGDMDKFSIYIHQNILVEGLNIPRIGILFVVSNFLNTKSLIQQVGRIVRNCKGKKEGQVYISNDMKEFIEEQWELYLEYDSKTDSEVYYKDRRFHKIFTLSSGFEDDIYLPKAASVFESKTSSYEEAIIHVENMLVRKASVRGLNICNDEKEKYWLLCYEKVSFSNLLRNKAYSEKTLECILVYEINIDDCYFLFYYDSSGYSFPIEMMTNHISKVPVEKIYRLLPSKTKFTDMKLSSATIANTNVNDRSYNGSNLQDIKTNVNERLSYCKAVKGKIEVRKDEFSRRYVGVTTSRINDNKRVGLVEYREWAHEIANKLLLGDSNNLFRRFASAFIPNEEIEPSSIIVDFSFCNELDNGIVDLKSNEIEVESIVENLKSNCFTFNFNGAVISGKVAIDKSRKNYSYKLIIPNFSKHIVRLDNGETTNLMSYINKKNYFKLFFSKEGVIYSNGLYFKPVVNFMNQKLENMDIDKSIVTIKKLGSCHDEKLGKYANKKNVYDWPDDSIFGTFKNELFDKHGVFKSYSFTDIVCDDLQKEISDFIALDNNNNKIVLVHCKHYKSTGTSASAFHDVCGQAQKNVHYINKNTISTLKHIQNHIDKWDKSWTMSKKFKPSKKEVTVNYECNRFIKGASNGEEFWKKYKNIMESVNASVEVWIVTDSLSKKDLKKELGKDLKKSVPKEQISQLMWMIYSTQEVLAEHGAELKIFCCE